VRESIRRRAALCVDRSGRFSIRDSGYAVMSHVWDETMGWQSPKGWGPVELPVRQRGVARGHFLRFFNRCDAEWLWVDVIAMPQVLEDMTPEVLAETEALRVGVINCFRDIVSNADHVVVLDSLLMRLRTRSPVDVAIVLCLSAWLSRMWTYVEAWLAKKVILKTMDSSFDLNKVIAFLGEEVLNEEDRYYGLLRRLWSLRNPAETGVVWKTSCDLERVFMGCENRYTAVEVDYVRVLFPLFDMPWQHGWTLEEGVAKLVQEQQNEGPWIQRWCNYHGISK
jgi:hypothetical protein